MVWGVEVEDPESVADLHRSAQGISRLLQLMTCISSLDRLIRIRVREQLLAIIVMEQSVDLLSSDF